MNTIVYVDPKLVTNNKLTTKTRPEEYTYIVVTLKNNTRGKKEMLIF